MMNGRVLVSATVISLKDSKFSYPCCRICYCKVYTKEDEKLNKTLWVCLKCKEKYEYKQVKLRYRLVLRITDGDHQADTTVFGTCLDRFFGTGADQFQRHVDSIGVSSTAPEEVVKQSLQDTFIGQMFIFGFKVNCQRTSSQKFDRSPLKLKEIMDQVEKTNHSGLLSTQIGSNQSLVAIQMVLSNRNQTTVTVMDNMKNYMKPQAKVLDETRNSLTPFSQESMPSSDGSTYTTYDYGQDSVLLSCEEITPAKKGSELSNCFGIETKLQEEMTQSDHTSVRHLSTPKDYFKGDLGNNYDSTVLQNLNLSMNYKKSDLSRRKTKDALILASEKDPFKSKEKNKAINSENKSLVTHQKSLDCFLGRHRKAHSPSISCDSIEIGRHTSLVEEDKGTSLKSISPTNATFQSDGTENELNDSVFLNLSMPNVVKAKELLNSQEIIDKNEVSELPYSEDIEEYLNMMDDSFDNYIKTEDLEHFSEGEKCTKTEAGMKADGNKGGEMFFSCDGISLEHVKEPCKKNGDIFENQSNKPCVTPKKKKSSSGLDMVKRNKDNSLHEKFALSVFKDVEEFMNESGVFEEASLSKEDVPPQFEICDINDLKDSKELDRSLNGTRSAERKNNMQGKSKCLWTKDDMSPQMFKGINSIPGRKCDKNEGNKSQMEFDCSADMFDTSYGSKCSKISSCGDASEDLFGTPIHSETDSPSHLITKTSTNPGIHSQTIMSTGETKKTIRRKSVYFSHILEDSQTIDNIDLIMRCTPTKKHPTPLKTCLKDTPVNTKTAKESRKPIHKRNCSKSKLQLDSPVMILRQKYARCLRSSMERKESTPLLDIGKIPSNKKLTASPIYDENQNAMQNSTSEMANRNKPRKREESLSEFEDSFVAGTQCSPSVLCDRTNLIKQQLKSDKRAKNIISLECHATQQANVNEIKPRKLVFASSFQESDDINTSVVASQDLFSDNSFL